MWQRHSQHCLPLLLMELQEVLREVLLLPVQGQVTYRPRGGGKKWVKGYMSGNWSAIL